jgi:hypothetical protein
MHHYVGKNLVTTLSRYNPKYTDPNVRIESADEQQLKTALQAIATWVQECTNAANPPEFRIYQTTQKNYAVNILIDNILNAAQPESFMAIEDPWALLQDHLDSGVTQKEQEASVQLLKTLKMPQNT